MSSSDSDDDDVMSVKSTTSNNSTITTTSIMTTRSMDSNLNDGKREKKLTTKSESEINPKQKPKSRRKAPLQGEPLLPLETLKRENAPLPLLVEQLYRHLKRQSQQSGKEAKRIKKEIIIQIENLQSQLQSYVAVEHRYQLQELLALTAPPPSHIESKENHKQHESDEHDVTINIERATNSSPQQQNTVEYKEVENLRLINDLLNKDIDKLRMEIEELKTERKLKNKVIETLTTIYEDFKIQERMGASTSSEKQTAAGRQVETNVKVLSYAETTATPKKPIKITPQPALLIRRTSNTSISTIRNILHQELKGDSILQKITCLPARDRDLLIVRADEEKVIDEVTNKIQKIQKLDKITELTMKPKNLRKIIILGIPKVIDEEAIQQKLLQMVGNNCEVTLFKTLTQEKLNTYQLVYEVEDFFAKKLMTSGKLLLNFHALRIRSYVPVVRCGKCQAFGHVAQKCRNDTYCQFCSGEHDSKTCKYQANPEKFECINCHIELKRTANHAASSSVCPVYKERHALRNNEINGNFSPSMR